MIYVARRNAAMVRNLLPLAAWLAIGAMMAVVPELQAQTEPFRIMPVGDSITVGYTNLAGQSEVPFTYGYRSGLYTQLTDAGYSFQYVGGSTEHPTPSSDCVNLAALNQDYHNGYGGQGISYIASNIASWMQADNPDVILLMIGINDIAPSATGNPISAESRLNSLVRTVVNAKPSAHLIVAQTIPYATGYTDSIVQYNNFIKNTLVPYYSGQGKLVTTVDQYSPFLTDGTIDSTLYSNAINHPSPEGYDRMAQTWFDGIQSLGVITHTPLEPGTAVLAITDVNLLSQKPVVASSVYSGSFDPSYATDGTVNDQVFKGKSDDGTDTDMRLVVHDISGPFNLIRIWQNVDDYNRVPSQVSIRSSSLDTDSLSAASFENELATVSNLAFNLDGYVDIRVEASADTRSLFFDFGGFDSLGQAYGVRIAEVQAFLVPEPATMASLMCGIIAMFGFRFWQRRKKHN